MNHASIGQIPALAFDVGINSCPQLESVLEPVTLVTAIIIAVL